MNHAYAAAKNEIPKRATYFVSFWWAIVWKEALALAVIVFFWQLIAPFSPSWWLQVPLALTLAIALYYFFP